VELVIQLPSEQVAVMMPLDQTQYFQLSPLLVVVEAVRSITVTQAPMVVLVVVQVLTEA
jgi:hypothetical protein